MILPPVKGLAARVTPLGLRRLLVTSCPLVLVPLTFSGSVHEKAGSRWSITADFASHTLLQA
jgi:hypothetical protein